MLVQLVVWMRIAAKGNFVSTGCVRPEIVEINKIAQRARSAKTTSALLVPKMPIVGPGTCVCKEPVREEIVD
jgi:hypothetical protein